VNDVGDTLKLSTATEGEGLRSRRGCFQLDNQLRNIAFKKIKGRWRLAQLRPLNFEELDALKIRAKGSS